MDELPVYVTVARTWETLEEARKVVAFENTLSPLITNFVVRLPDLQPLDDAGTPIPLPVVHSKIMRAIHRP